MEKIIKKKYLKIEFSLASPLGIGSGENEKTDKDIIRNSAGEPYIPASAIAGVISDKLGKKDNSVAKRYLGDVIKADPKKNDKGDQTSSKIVFYDARLKNKDYHVSIRDSVALDEYKTAKKGAKFDMEVLEPGAEFVTYIEQNLLAGDEDFCQTIAEVFAACEIVLGGKGTRGYGKIALTSINQVEFDLTKTQDVDKWLGFSLTGNDYWEPYDINVKSESSAHTLVVGLKLVGGISIRKYTTDPRKDGELQPDMEQLTIHDSTAVIPGTSWAGAIRHRMKEFGVSVDSSDSIFGHVKDDKTKGRSKIVFEESYLKDSKEKILSRNAIDRFTGGTVDGALFTEKTNYGGTTDLTIRWLDKQAMPEKEQKALAAALTDLHMGFLAVGGETSIGRGLFHVTSVNGDKVAKDEKPEEVYETILKHIKEDLK